MIARSVRTLLFLVFLAGSTIVGAPTAFASGITIPRTTETSYCPVSVADTEKIDAVISPQAKTKIENDLPFFVGSVQAATVDAAHYIPTLSPIPESSSNESHSSLNPDVIFQLINDHRKSIGLPEYQKEDRLCALAKERGPELQGEAESGAIHAGFDGRNLPYWATENMKYGASREQDVFDWWMNSSIHRKAIEANYLYSCGECYGDACIQLFTSFQAK